MVPFYPFFGFRVPIYNIPTEKGYPYCNMSYSLNSLKGGYIGDYLGDYYRGY